MILSSTDLLLDDKIRDWVLIPIVIVVFLVAIVRHNVATLLQSEQKPDLKKIQQRHTLMRSQLVRAHANLLPAHSFEQRRQYFNDSTSGVFKVEESGDAATNALMNPMMDPMHMMEMVKNNVTSFVPQLLLMAWVAHFFSGFVMVKVPFPLTVAFRGMLQRDVGLDTLEVTWVSSLSWYFLALFGLRGINSLVLGEGNAADDAKIMRQQMEMGMGSAMMDFKAAYKSERENMELVEHHWTIEDAEKRLLAQAS